MAQKKAKSPKQKSRVGTTKNRVKADSQKSRKTLLLVLRFVRPLLFIGIVWALVSFNKGYDRLYKYNIVRTSKDIEKYKGMDYEARLKKMLPQDFPFLASIRDMTPEDAVILAPPNDIWYPKDRKLGIGKWMHSKSYLSYFLYPRKIVYDTKDEAKSPIMRDVTHVLIIDSWGYDKLSYEVRDRPPFTVMPIQKK